MALFYDFIGVQLRLPVAYFQGESQCFIYDLEDLCVFKLSVKNVILLYFHIYSEF